nr:hypothetical protein Iba_chr03bCG4790 [Ipomoea batatas]
MAGKRLAMAEATAPLPPATSTSDVTPSKTSLDASLLNSASTINCESLVIASLKGSLYPESWEKLIISHHKAACWRERIILFLLIIIIVSSVFGDQKQTGVDQKVGEAVDVGNLGRMDGKGRDEVGKRHGFAMVMDDIWYAYLNCTF